MTQARRAGKGSRGLVGGGALLFLLSTAFPVVASLLRVEVLPRWVGIADVVVAFAAVLVGIAIASRKPAGFEEHAVQSAFVVYRATAHLFLALLLVFFAAGDRVDWSVLLPGLAWRGWLFVWVLPSASSVWASGEASPGSRR
jgi:ABC-type microcin C transport system permease subunit YejB